MASEASTIGATVIVAVRNEAINLPRCLDALGRFERVIVVDSHSADDSEAISIRHGAEVVQFDYRGGYPKKRQWALDTLSIETPWVLLVDADEVAPPELANEIRAATARNDGPAGYLIQKAFHFLGKRFRYGGFSHSAILLVQRGRARFEHLLDEPADALDMEVHERLLVDGPIGRLRTPLIHEDFKGLEAYLDRHNRYSTWEACVRFENLAGRNRRGDAIRPRLWGNVQERRRWLKNLAMRTPGEPWLWFLYHYVGRLGLFEGRRGLIASRIRAQYISQVRAKLYEMRLQASLNQRASGIELSTAATSDMSVRVTPTLTERS